MQDVLSALADPRRRAILQLLRGSELPAGKVAEQFGDVTRQAVSLHLQVLVEVGLLAERREGTRRLFSARPEGLGELREFVAEFWDERLEVLRREAESDERKRQHERRDN